MATEATLLRLLDAYRVAVEAECYETEREHEWSPVLQRLRDASEVRRAAIVAAFAGKLTDPLAWPPYPAMDMGYNDGSVRDGATGRLIPPPCKPGFFKRLFGRP